ncbi:MAG: hypothetical protein JNK07_09125 [Alphaproteobacteria bacterium]|nr:hypothetical protein [Alphaproteobacteria bacterium]
MARVVYSRDELMAEHAYAKPQIEAGYRLHGGFDANGTYISPRTLHRWPAVEAWQAQVKGRGFPIIDASTRLLKRGAYPGIDQQKLLLGHGMGETLWNALTITGVIEARGRALCDAEAPDFQKIIEEDVSATSIGHLNKGLLFAHGLDEGGDKANGQGGHDDMWFAVRDALFGKDAFPLPEVPASIARPEIGRLMPMIDKVFEDWTLLLMNVLMIEVRAEAFFSFCTNLMRSPDVFRDRRPAAMHAAELVERIRTDEAIHVAYLQTFVSEMRSFTIKTLDGGRIKGAQMIDPIWEGMIHWHSVTQADFSREQSREAIVARIKKRTDAPGLLAQFDALEHKAAA